MLGTKEIINKETDIIIYKNFISNEYCKELINFFNSSLDDWRPICFYGSYGMHIVAPFNSTHNTSITEEEIKKY